MSLAEQVSPGTRIGSATLCLLAPVGVMHSPEGSKRLLVFLTLNGGGRVHLPKPSRWS